MRMFTTAAYAADATGGAADSLTALLPPMIMVLAITYFIAIRPQQRKQKELRDMLAVLRRGDTVVTSSGLVGRISKVLNDNEVQVELAEGVRVRMLKAAVIEIRTKGEPVKDAGDASDDASSEAGALGDAIEGTLSPDEGQDATGNVKPLPANTNKSSARPPFQKSKGRRR
jgi:preprotein translocase subunit YajC